MSEAEPGVDFEAFVLETSEHFARVAQATSGDVYNAEDAVQVAYLRMFRRWDKLSAREGSLVAYGRTAVKRAVIDQFRRNQRVTTIPLQEIPEKESSVGIPGAAYEMIKVSMN